MDEFHEPVLLKEAIDFLQVEKGGIYVDCTLGGGGYAVEILKRGGKLIGIDCDPEAVGEVQRKLKQLRGPMGGNWQLFCDNFKNLKEIVEKAELSPFAHPSHKASGDHTKPLAKCGKASGDSKKVDGVIFDLGVSMHQLKTENRGFSFLKDAPLDMRMDPRLKVTAMDLVNALTEKELYVLFGKFGEERNALPIARAILGARGLKKIKTTGELAQIVEKVYQKNKSLGNIHAATKVFQALRMAVNSELSNLKAGLDASLHVLGKGKRLVVVSFHSLEDGMVKDFLRLEHGNNILEILTKKPIVPTVLEVEQNPSSRSAKLRAGEKQ